MLGLYTFIAFFVKIQEFVHLCCHVSRSLHTTNNIYNAGPSGRSPTAIVGSNPTGGMDVCLVCVLSGRGLCDELITRPEESYRLWRVVVCD
jgi:hypothetical protein